MNPKDYLTPQQIKTLSGVKNIENIWKWIREKRFPVIQFGRNYVIEKKEWEKFWAGHKSVLDKWRKDRGK